MTTKNIKQRLQTLLKTIMLKEPNLYPDHGTSHFLGVTAEIIHNPDLGPKFRSSFNECISNVRELLRTTTQPELVTTGLDGFPWTESIVNTLAVLAAAIPNSHHKLRKDVKKRYQEFRAVPRFQRDYRFMHTLVNNTKRSLNKLEEASKTLSSCVDMARHGPELQMAKQRWRKEAHALAIADGCCKRSNLPRMIRYKKWL